MNVNSAAPLRMYCARSGIVAMLPKRFIGYCPALIGSPQAIHWPVDASVITRLKPCATARATGALNYNSVLSAFGCAALPRKPMVGFAEAERDAVRQHVAFVRNGDRSAAADADAEIACSRIANRQLAQDSAAWRWPARRPDEITESPGIEAVLTKKPSCERTLEILASSLDAAIAGTPPCSPTGTQRKETQQPPYRRSGDKNKFMQTAGPACD
ncbi:hypothetical protein [Burkholderia cepacia]|uniref:hypothetical protein n=1 Tax=Burkholderia cepacia TaxID=292 RepID=UPI0012D95FDF|nr:hypothetical protein [Burkholderia cepacia]